MVISIAIVTVIELAMRIGSYHSIASIYSRV